ncbi:MAG: tetratricopeptide repeat protein [Candidatus Methanoperedens sp.]|nr:tetratricopeptide repeat protein [Candidatus Methanoperedens sp.]
MKYTKIFDSQEGLKANRLHIFILCFIFIPFSFMLPFVEAKTADEWYNEGNDLGRSGKYAEAINAYDETLKINPQDAYALNNKGIVLKNLGRNDVANKVFDKASQLQKSPGFEIIFAIVGLLTIVYFLRRKIDI